jgi:hypothetical protein
MSLVKALRRKASSNALSKKLCSLRFLLLKIRIEQEETEGAEIAGDGLLTVYIELPLRLCVR